VGERLEVPFQYTVELDRNLAEENFLSTVVPELEVSMNDYLVPVIFPDSICPAVERQRTLQSRRRRLATIVGMTARPFDTVDNDIECTAADFCYGMRGALTLFLTGGERRRLQSVGEFDDAAQIQLALERGMTSGVFNNNPPIVRVSYVRDSRDTDSNRSFNGSDDDLNLKIALPLIIGSCLLLVLLFIWLRNREYGDMEIIGPTEPAPPAPARTAASTTSPAANPSVVSTLPVGSARGSNASDNHSGDSSLSVSSESNTDARPAIPAASAS